MCATRRVHARRAGAARAAAAEAAERFARGDSVREVARDLRVTEGSVRRLRRAWQVGGTEALRSKEPVSRERLSPQQLARLEAELKKGPLAHGFDRDQRWTLGRIKTLCLRPLGAEGGCEIVPPDAR